MQPRLRTQWVEANWHVYVHEMVDDDAVYTVPLKDGSGRKYPVIASKYLHDKSSNGLHHVGELYDIGNGVRYFIIDSQISMSGTWDKLQKAVLKDDKRIFQNTYSHQSSFLSWKAGSAEAHTLVIILEYVASIYAIPALCTADDFA